MLTWLPRVRGAELSSGQGARANFCSRSCRILTLTLTLYGMYLSAKMMVTPEMKRLLSLLQSLVVFDAHVANMRILFRVCRIFAALTIISSRKMMITPEMHVGLGNL